MKDSRNFDEITVFGARGHTQMILSGLEEHWRGRVRVRALIDDIENGFDHAALGVPVISSDQRLQQYPHLPVLLGVSNPLLRRRVVARLSEEGATLATETCNGRANVDPSARFGSGTICMPWTRIGPNVEIGACAIILGYVIAHDVRIGAFSTLAIDTVISGHVEIGENVNLAPRAVVANGTRHRLKKIGDGAEIGSGAVVVSDVAPRSRMIGNPAMPLRDWVRLRQIARGEAQP